MSQSPNPSAHVATDIPTWQERIGLRPDFIAPVEGWPSSMLAMMAEIADLRAALASRAPASPQLSGNSGELAPASGAPEWQPVGWVPAGQCIVMHNFPGMLTNCISAATTEKRKEFCDALLSAIQYEIAAAGTLAIPLNQGIYEAQRNAAESMISDNLKRLGLVDVPAIPPQGDTEKLKGGPK